MIAIIAILSFVGSVAFISVQLWRRRQADRAAVVATTSQGVQLRPGPFRSLWRPEMTTDIEQALDLAIRFWCQRYPLKAGAIRRAFRGARIEMRGTRIPQPETGYLAHGLTDGRIMTIAWLPEDTWITVLSLVRHEAGHVALEAAGIYGEAEHHLTMAREAYGA